MDMWNFMGKLLAAFLMGIAGAIAAIALSEWLIPRDTMNGLPISDVSIALGLFFGTLGGYFGWRNAEEVFDSFIWSILERVLGRLLFWWV